MTHNMLYVTFVIYFIIAYYMLHFTYTVHSQSHIDIAFYIFCITYITYYMSHIWHNIFDITYCILCYTYNVTYYMLHITC